MHDMQNQSGFSDEDVARMERISHQFIADSAGMPPEQMFHTLSSMVVSYLSVFIAIAPDKAKAREMTKPLIDAFVADMRRKMEYATSDATLGRVMQQVEAYKRAKEQGLH